MHISGVATAQCLSAFEELDLNFCALRNAWDFFGRRYFKDAIAVSAVPTLVHGTDSVAWASIDAASLEHEVLLGLADVGSVESEFFPDRK
jgi:hypothetical protein